MMIKTDKAELVALLDDLFGPESVDTYDKNVIHVWRDGVLILIIRENSKSWSVSFSTALNSLQAAMLTASLFYLFDFIVGPAFLRMSDGVILDGPAALAYTAEQIAKAYNKGIIAHTVPYEVFDEKLKDGILTNRHPRYTN